MAFLAPQICIKSRDEDLNNSWMEREGRWWRKGGKEQIINKILKRKWKEGTNNKN